jgi:sarcosine oxidase, subunit gamma
VVELQALTALGAHAPVQVTVGPLTITERIDVALASVAARRGKDLAGAARAAGLPLAEPGHHLRGVPYSTFWTAPEMWFVEAPFASHELIAEMLKSDLGDTASVTEQTDAWVIFDLVADDLSPVLERLCNVDFPAAVQGYATRTMIDHLGCYLIKHDLGAARILGPRSSAQSLLHALKVAAASAW